MTWACYNVAVPILNAGQRVKRNIRRLLDEQRGIKGPRRTQSGLARALGNKQNAVSSVLSAADVPHFKLRELDVIAEYFGVTPATLIAQDGNELWELTPSEMRVIRLWREWPPEIQEAVLSILSYFAALSPAETMVRRYLSKFRRLRRRDQEYVERTVDSLLRHTAAPDTTVHDAHE